MGTRRLVSPLATAALLSLAIAACERSCADRTSPPAPAQRVEATASAPPLDPEGPPPAPPPSASELAKLATASNAFGFDLYARLRAQPGNLVLSPASISTALAMTLAGAR